MVDIIKMHVDFLNNLSSKSYIFTTELYQPIFY